MCVCAVMQATWEPYGHITGMVLMHAGNVCHLMHTMNIITLHHFSSSFLIVLLI